MRVGAFAAHSRESGNPEEAAGSPPSRGRADHAVTVAGVTLVADPAGALYWPDEGLLVVADLHLEKGSAFAGPRRAAAALRYCGDTGAARRGSSNATRRVLIALGDSFHDDDGPLRMASTDRGVLKALQQGRDWVWIAGNHDADLPDGVGGRFADEFCASVR